MSSTGRVKNDLHSQLCEARFRADELFQLIRPDALYERPISERHRIVFYLGHMGAFDWNLICAGPFEMTSFNSEFDRLFAFGIDPTHGDLPDDEPRDWPSQEEIRRYNLNVRASVDRCLTSASDVHLFWVAIEHRLMHAETLAYMLHWLPYEQKLRRIISFEPGDREPGYERIDIPAGVATLGVKNKTSDFGWDNEFPGYEAHVPSFSIDKYKVTNAQFAMFVEAGGYLNRQLWNEAAWKWISASEIRHPKFWKGRDNTWFLRSMFGEIPFQPSWPVYVSHAEADAYTRWQGKSLPTEAQFHRAAFGTQSGDENRYSWGNDDPKPCYGNFNFLRWTPAPVDAHPRGTSAFGVADLIGNGWEWTSTPFKAFPGFEAMAFYPGYSANFFDGQHFVLKGGSPRTAAGLLRRSFRNWFQPLYPNIYASFRCVEN